MGPCSTSEDENSLRYGLGLTSATTTPSLSRETPTKETPTKETPETAETHVEKRLRRLWVRIEETLKRLRWTSAGRSGGWHGSVVLGGGR
jgi:hypothetical protein